MEGASIIEPARTTVAAFRAPDAHGAKTVASSSSIVGRDRFAHLNEGVNLASSAQPSSHLDAGGRGSRNALSKKQSVPDRTGGARVRGSESERAGVFDQAR